MLWLQEEAIQSKETVQQTIPLLDEEGKHSGWYKQIVAKVDAVNSNKRYYPKGVYEAALNQLKREGFPFAGEHPHPKSYQGVDGKIYFQTSIPNTAVKFRDAYFDPDGNVWAEFTTLGTNMGRQVQAFIDTGLPIGFSNRMTGKISKKEMDGESIEVAEELQLFTWDIVLNPSEQEAFCMPKALADQAADAALAKKDRNKRVKEEQQKNIQKGKGKKMEDLFGKSLEALEALEAWKEENPDSTWIGIVNKLIVLRKEEEKLKQQQGAAKESEVGNPEAAEKKREKEQAQAYLKDAIEKMPYQETIKNTIRRQGKQVESIREAALFLEAQKELLDSALVQEKMASLGIRADGKQERAMTMTEYREETAIMDGMMQEMDRELLKRNANFQIDWELRKANRAVIDSVFQQMNRDHGKEYIQFQRALMDEASDFDRFAIGDTGKFAQTAKISMAILYQAWQDVKFLQLCLTEGFSGSTYKMPVEFQSHDLLTEEDFTCDEIELIPTESVATYLLEFSAKWLKRGFIVTKEAEKELRQGPLRYDAIAANAASIAMHFNRIIDKMISTEMVSRADEYQARRIESENVKASEVSVMAPGVDLPEGSNAKYCVKLCCGNPTPLNQAVMPPIVRPRVSVWLDPKGRKQQEQINPIIVTDAGGTELNAGIWMASRGAIVNQGGKEAQYAVDYENACIYFKDGVISPTDLPTVSYSYATSLSFFNLAIPTAMQDFSARYYNGILELLDREKAYMGSAPRFVTPDFVLGSLKAMTPIKQAELFYQRALPNGTSLLGGELYFAKRNGMNFCEHNTPWVAGDNRILLGKQNAVRVGMGSPYELEGPYPHLAENGLGYTSAKEYFATQQIAVNTPLVIDENGTQYHPPFRSIKFYQAAH